MATQGVRRLKHTQGLDIIFVPTAFDIFDHQTGFSNLRITHHADLDDDTALARRLRLSVFLILCLLMCAHSGARP